MGSEAGPLLSIAGDFIIVRTSMWHELIAVSPSFGLTDNYLNIFRRARHGSLTGDSTGTSTLAGQLRSVLEAVLKYESRDLFFVWA